MNTLAGVATTSSPIAASCLDSGYKITTQRRSLSALARLIASGKRGNNVAW